MKKIIITIMTILVMMTLASCDKVEHEVTKHVIVGTATMEVTERTIKNGEVIEEIHYTIEYDSPEKAFEASKK